MLTVSCITLDVTLYCYVYLFLGSGGCPVRGNVYLGG